MEDKKNRNKAVISAFLMLIMLQSVFAQFKTLPWAKCPAGSLPYYKQCLDFVYFEEYTFEDASFLCKFVYGKDSRLASVSSEDMLKFLNINVFRPSIPDRFPRGNFWVGSTNEDGVHTWEDGVPMDQQPWIQRNNSISGNCYIYTGNGVTNEKCNAKHGLICVVDKIQYIPSENCLYAPNQDSFIGGLTGNCIFRTPDATTKENADAKCDEYGGRFLDLNEILVDGQAFFASQKEKRSWEQLFVNDFKTYWTNLKTNGTTVVTSAGEPLHGDSLIVHPDQGECVAVAFYVKDDLEIEFHQMECESQAYVMCSMPVVSSEVN